MSGSMPFRGDGCCTERFSSWGAGSGASLILQAFIILNILFYGLQKGYHSKLLDSVALINAIYQTKSN